ncbi:hypothetical protein [Formosa sp. PL04]|uniref:hypothetical protein n=1 Tax=Formosa sp. PL04 TaxID=3081755 RepID=UPI002981CCE9|nr:hypothetical protein [Formosa sp. PL04]MDW5289602.1 hypothetical protein [Formosa sp. PL04]
MNTGTLILSAFFIVICALPFILSTRGSRKRKNAMLKAVTEIATKNNATISKYDVGADFVIGLDDVKNLVFFFKKTLNNTIENCLDLSDYKDCRTLKFSKNLNSNSKSQAIQTLKLNFIPIDKTTTESLFEFYNEDVNTQLSGELQIIETWQTLIQQKLTAK